MIINDTKNSDKNTKKEGILVYYVTRNNFDGLDSKKRASKIKKLGKQLSETYQNRFSIAIFITLDPESRINFIPLP